MDSFRSKIKNWSSASILVEKWKEKGGKIVFTNGCFDILHKGHLSYLEEARKLGDRLIVGINGDESVTKLKGVSRPLNSLEERCFHLAALFMVDMVVPFAQDTPEKLIETLMPDILVKGGDYKESDIVGASYVKKKGGEVVILPFLEGYSTTSIIDKIKAL